MCPLAGTGWKADRFIPYAALNSVMLLGPVVRKLQIATPSLREIPRALAYVSLASLVLLSGCTLKQYAAQADRAAYRTLAHGQKSALGETYAFDVTYDPIVAGNDRAKTIQIGEKVIHLNGEGAIQTLTLDDCLEIAYRTSNEFQDRVEELYSDALALANTRRGWDIPLFDGAIGADISTASINDGAERHRASAQLTSDDGETRSADASGTFAKPGASLVQRFVNGGVLLLATAVDWSTDFAGDTGATSLLRANFTQPLLRGAWRGFAYEDQYRLERDFIFAVYDYERFRQTFATDVFSEYYRILRVRDGWANELANIKRLELTFALTRPQAEAGQVSRIQQDQAEQDLLNAKVRSERLEQQYRDALDAFKIEVGLPIAANVKLDYPGALKELEDTGLQPIGFGEEEAIRIEQSSPASSLNSSIPPLLFSKISDCMA